MPNTTIPASATGLPFARNHGRPFTILDTAALSERLERERLRRRLEDAVTRLIEAMDALDAPGEDLEPQGDEEPSLGFLERCYLNGVASNCDDREDDTADDEPSLGAPEQSWWNSQASWAKGCRDDREFDGDTVADPDLEDSDDAEAVNEDGCAMGGTDNGLADQDALEWTVIECEVHAHA